MMLSKVFSEIQTAVLGLGLLALSGAAAADCLTDVKKYRFDKELYNECIREANNTDNAELQYLVALWNFAGVREVDFQTQRNMNGYKHFIHLAAQGGNLDAMSMYVITQYDRDNVENNGKDLNMVKYLNALAEDKSPEGILRMLVTKMQIGKFRETVELPELVKLADEPDNLKAKFELARYYQSRVTPVDVRADLISKAYEYYKPIIESKSDDDNVRVMRGQSLWNMYGYYMKAKNAEEFARAEPFLKQLAYSGDILAMGEYAVSYDTSRFGILDDSKAYAWAGRAMECAKGTIFENEYGSSEFFEKVNKKLSDEERKKGEAELAELRKSVKCIAQPKPKRPESEVKAKDPADKKSDAGTKK